MVILFTFAVKNLKLSYLSGFDPIVPFLSHLVNEFTTSILVCIGY